MRVVFVNGKRFWGGAEKRHLSQATFLMNRGHEVYFFSAPQGEVARRVKEAGVPIEEFGFLNDVDIISFFRLYSAFRRIKPDVVIFNSNRELRLAGAAAALAGIRVRVQCKEISGLKDNRRYRLTYRHLCTHTLCVADALREEIVSLGWLDPMSVKVIHTYVDLCQFTPEGPRKLRREIGAGDDDMIIGAVARISSIKGFEFLIGAMPEIIKACPKVKCVLVGKGRLEQDLKNMVNRMGLKDAVIFLGFVENPADTVRSLDVAVYPSVHTEGLPHSVLESMACGVPVVSTPISGIPEAVEDGVTGLLVPPNDAGAVAEAIISLIRDPERRRAMAQAARKKVEKEFNRDDKMAELENWLKEIIAEN